MRPSRVETHPPTHPPNHAMTAQAARYTAPLPPETRTALHGAWSATVRDALIVLATGGEHSLPASLVAHGFPYLERRALASLITEGSVASTIDRDDSFGYALLPLSFLALLAELGEDLDRCDARPGVVRATLTPAPITPAPFGWDSVVA